MRFGQTILCLTIALGAAFGCEREPSAKQAEGSAKPQAAAEAAVPVKPDQQPQLAPTTRPSVIILVDGEQREFPPPRLVVDDRNGKTVALLMSDDPPQAINDDYAGNSYYIEMEFDDALPTVRGQVWVYEAPNSDKQDSPNGIFLEGNRKQLQPFQVKVQFQQVDGGDVAWISGTFHFYHNNDAQPSLPRVVTVTGRLPVTLP